MILASQVLVQTIYFDCTLENSYRFLFVTYFEVMILFMDVLGFSLSPYYLLVDDQFSHELQYRLLILAPVDRTSVPGCANTHG